MPNFDYAKLYDNARTNVGLIKTYLGKLNGLLVRAKETGDKKLIDKVEKGIQHTSKVLKNGTKKLDDIKLGTSHKPTGAKPLSSVPVPKLLPQTPKSAPREFDNVQLVAFTGAAIAFTAIVASAILYKRFLSRAAKACTGQKGFQKENCMTKFKIAGYEASVKSLQRNLPDCSQAQDPFKCKHKIQDKIVSYAAKIRKHKKKLSETTSMNFLNGYLEYLNEDRGINLPIEADNKPNYIRICMMQEDDRVKIRCLRKLKEITAMNPFYQYRIDRFVDAITNTYEATREPGFNEYKND